MKIERFDDEIKRKLLGLTTSTDSSEVDRIHAHVRKNLPTSLNKFQGKRMILFDICLLTVSLLYNTTSYIQNAYSRSSLVALEKKQNSVKNRKRSVVTFIHEPKLKTLTNSYCHSVVITSKISKLSKDLKDIVLLNVSPKNIVNRGILGRITRQNMFTTDCRQSEQMIRMPFTVGVYKIDTLLTSTKKSSNKRLVNTEIQPTQISNRGFKNLTPFTNNSPLLAKPTINKLLKIHRVSVKNMITSSTPQKLKEITQIFKAEQIKQERGIWPVKETSVMNQTVIGDSLALILVSTHKINQSITFLEPLPKQQLSQHSRFDTYIKVNHSLNLYQFQASKPAIRRAFARSILTNSYAQYRVGVGLILGGKNKVGEAVLGEVVFKQHWSIQAGIQTLYSPVYHYRDERDFDDQHLSTFRQVYVDQLPLTVTAEDIRQKTIGLQVPLQIAYYSPINLQWRLRLGIGTDLTIRDHNMISYSYKENSHIYKGEFTQVELLENVFNNFTVTPAVERYYNKWLFRAGPFINSKLHIDNDNSKGFSWGMSVQSMYQLGKKSSSVTAY